MPRGGARPGAGRPKGAKTRRGRELVEAVVSASSDAGREIVGRFQGDAHAYMVEVYQNPDYPPELRLDAAKAAAPYEKPRLAALAVKTTTDDAILTLFDWLERQDAGLAKSMGGEQAPAAPVRH